MEKRLYLDAVKKPDSWIRIDGISVDHYVDLEPLNLKAKRPAIPLPATKQAIVHVSFPSAMIQKDLVHLMPSLVAELRTYRVTPVKIAQLCESLNQTYSGMSLKEHRATVQAILKLAKKIKSEAIPVAVGRKPGRKTGAILTGRNAFIRRLVKKECRRLSNVDAVKTHTRGSYRGKPWTLSVATLSRIAGVKL
jgi:hypothetical protein